MFPCLTIEQPTQLVCMNELGGKEIGTHQEQGHVAAFHSKTDCGPPFLAGIDSIARANDGDEDRERQYERYSLQYGEHVT